MTSFVLVARDKRIFVDHCVATCAMDIFCGLYNPPPFIMVKYSRPRLISEPHAEHLSVMGVTRSRDMGYPQGAKYLIHY